MADWDNCDFWTRCLIITYDQVRQFEEAEELQMLMKAGAMPRL